MLVLNSILLGIGLAMDAFSVSIVNGLNEPHMKRSRMVMIAGTYGVYQALMPLIGWICVTGFMSLFAGVRRYIPWIAFVLLTYIGAKMIYDSIKSEKKEIETKELTIRDIQIQGIATSIDAFSAGLAMAQYDLWQSFAAVSVIASVTFMICLAGLKFGRKVGEKIKRGAGILGGVILMGIGIEILIKGLMGL